MNLNNIAEVLYAYFEALKICAKGASKTRIVYQANLNFKIINFYLDLLTKNGLIKVKNELIPIYETTPNGLCLLDNFKRIQNELYPNGPLITKIYRH